MKWILVAVSILILASCGSNPPPAPVAYANNPNSSSIIANKLPVETGERELTVQPATATKIEESNIVKAPPTAAERDGVDPSWHEFYDEVVAREEEMLQKGGEGYDIKKAGISTEA